MKMKALTYACLIQLLVIHLLQAETDTGSSTRVYVIPIRAEIDSRATRQVMRGLEEARKLDAELLIFDINTFGGEVGEADKIRTLILEYPKKSAAFININAASAGALISLACDSIYMQEGSSIGSATVVDGQTGTPLPEKYQSYMRSMMRATAEANHRNPIYAEAMVDESIHLDSSIKCDGKLLAFTTSEAIKYGYCEAQINKIEDILIRYGYKTASYTEYTPDIIEQVALVFMNPVVSGLLILLMIGGIYFEFQAPGLGLPILVSILAALAYFVPFYIQGLAQNWEIILFFVGIFLLILEVFVLPGFGFIGIFGIVGILLSLILSMLNNDYFDFSAVPQDKLSSALWILVIGILGMVTLVWLVGSKMLNSKAFKTITQEGSSINPEETKAGTLYAMVGIEGVATTPLKPVGKIKVEGLIYDAITSGEYLDINTPVEIVEVVNNVLKVKSRL